MIVLAGLAAVSTTNAAVTISCLPAAGPIEVGKGFSTTCTASGGTGPYSWSISAGALPAGINSPSPSTGASTTISGTPTTPGAYAFTVQASDSLSATGTQPFSGTIAA